MQESIKLLIELQGIDSVILRDKNIIESMPAKLLSADHALKEIQADSDRQKQRYAALEKKKKDKERAVEDINEKINKSKSRTSEIKTNKEYQAHLKEIENVEKERYAAEDEILAIMEEIEAAGKTMKAEEAKITAEKQKIEALKKEIEQEIASAEKELSEKKGTRADVANKIDPDIYKDYMTVLEARHGLAIVEVRDEICQGCNMNIPPQLFVEIKQSDEIIQCPQCRRILYWMPTQEKGQNE